MYGNAVKAVWQETYELWDMILLGVGKAYSHVRKH